MKNNKNLHEGMANAAALSDEELSRVDGGVFLMPELEELINLQKKEKRSVRKDDPVAPVSPKDMV